MNIEYNKRGNEIFIKQQAEVSLNEMTNRILGFNNKPLISVIMPIYNAPVPYLQLAVESLQKQVYENWELCVVDDGSRDGRGYSLLEEMAVSDQRICVIHKQKNEGISMASNVALEMAHGEYIALMDQDDELPNDAFFWVVKTINEIEDIDWIYTDECKIGSDSMNSKTDFYFKPDWSPELLINHMYTGHLSIYRKKVIEKSGGFRKRYDFSQDYDLALRISDITDKIFHLERVLYFWRMLPTSGAAGGKDFARETNLLALKDWYQRQGIDGYAQKNGLANYFSIKKLHEPLISIIIPSDSYENMMNCVGKILSVSSYRNIEIILVTNSKTGDSVKEEFEYNDIVKICHFNRLYNFSEKCNVGAEMAHGDFLIFYNDDVVPYSIDWMERLLEIMLIRNVGGVSPLMLHEDMTVQYAGMISGVPGLFGTAFNSRQFGILDSAIFHHLLIRDVSILSGACMIISKDIFNKIGGFDAQNTPNGHSDADISFKLREIGLRCVYTPYASMVHIGNHSWREPSKQDKSDIYCLKRWGKNVATDPYFTDSMKKIFYNDITYLYKIYAPIELANTSGGKNILIITHELSRSGAPVVLFDLVKTLIENNCFPVVLSFRDGPLKAEYLGMGVTVIVADSVYFDNKQFRNFAFNFDLVVACTLGTSTAVRALGDIYPNVLWWLHEGKMAYDHFASIVPQTLADNIHVYCGGEYSKKIMEKHINKKINILNYGVEQRSDEKGNLNKIDLSKIRFLVAGKIERRKGQDILVQAIELLPADILKKIEFVFIGEAAEKSVYSMIDKLAKKQECQVRVLDSVSREELFDFYQEVDCLIAPSRDDPMPVVATEAMMFGKPCICSSAVGTASYIENGINGYIFESENIEDLSKILHSIAVKGKEELQAVGIQSRKIYDTVFSYEIFKKNAMEIISALYS